MPYKACLTCGVLITKGSRCPTHQKEAASLRERARGSASQRGYDAEWQRIRAQVLLEEPACRRCGGTEDLTVDHILSRKNGGDHSRVNLQTLCFDCNRKKGGNGE